MNNLSEIYINIQSRLFPMVEEEIGELTNFSTSTCWLKGKSGKALDFDGDNDYVNCGNDNSLELEEFTYAAWIKPDNITDDYQQIIGKSGIWNKGFFITILCDLFFYQFISPSGMFD